MVFFSDLHLTYKGQNLIKVEVKVEANTSRNSQKKDQIKFEDLSKIVDGGLLTVKQKEPKTLRMNDRHDFKVCIEDLGPTAKH